MKNCRPKIIFQVVKNTSGFILLDVLLAFTCLIIISIYFLPMVNQVMNHEENMERSVIAEENLSRLLIESLDQSLDHAGKQATEILIQGYTYQFNVEHQLTKIYGCLLWKNHRSELESMCSYVPIYHEY